MAELMVGGKAVLVDDEDVERLSKIHWCLTSRDYAIAKLPKRNGRKTSMGMHRFILGDPDCQHIDHINRNPLDNRKANLREATASENCRNVPARKHGTSRHRGVSWSARKAAWQVVIREDGKLKWKGYYQSEDEAARVAAPHFVGIAP